VFPMGCGADERTARARRRIGGSRAKTAAVRGSHRARRNLGCQAPPVSCAGTFGGIVYGRVVGRCDVFLYKMTGVQMSADVLSKLANLLSFVALGLTILLIVRTRLEGQVRVFGAQSVVLALLSMLIALYSNSLE